MSKTVDERVVEMRFDNKQFESGVQTSMSTLDKLKHALKLDDAAKGLDNVSKTAKNFDVSGMSNGLESVTAKFSALDVIGVTALANITNSAVNAGKNLVKALTIEPVTTGFNEYELKMNSIQTIMMSTGESVDTVNRYLNELNKYSDDTIYSFQDMTSNIGKFTNAGVKLEDAVNAIKGISNEAAVSGANANEASRAMYNFSQALSAGYVKLIDWKSIENANMATVEFKQQLIDTAVEMGTLTKTTDGLYNTGKTAISATQNFNDSLQDQWMTSEVLIETLKKYADNETDIGKKAFSAAQDVKTFSQVIDILKETAQSGWAQTWELIFGNIEEAKAIFTPLTNFFSGIINSISGFRNGILEAALSSPFGGVIEKISAVKETTDEAVETVKDLGEVVNRVINGEFGSGEERFKKLTEEGYNWARVQNKVNEQLGYSVRHEEGITEAIKEQKKQASELTDEKLKEIGLNDEEIEQYHQLKKAADKAGLSVEEYAKKIDRVDGRTLLVESFQNIGNAITGFGKAVKEAWNDIFPDTQQKLGESLYNLIDGFHNLTSGLKDFDDEADKIKRTFKGVFALLDIVSTLIGGPLKFGLKVLCKALGMVDVDALSVTASIGDMIVAFRDWLFENNRLIKGFKKVVEGVKELAKAFLEIPKVKEVIDSLKAIDFTEIGRNIVEGLQNGIESGINKLPDGILKICKQIYDIFVNFFDINSPSKLMFTVGAFIIAGLLLGLKDGFGDVGKFVESALNNLKITFSNFDWNKLFAAGISISSIVMIKKLIDIFDNLAAPLSGVGDLLSGVGNVLDESSKQIAKVIKSTSKVIKSTSKVVKAFANDLNAVAFKIRAKALLDIAKAVAILVGSVAALTFINQDKLWSAVGVVTVLSLVLAGLAWAASKMSASSTTLNKEGLKVKNAIPSILGIAAAIYIVAKAVETMGSMEPDKWEQGIFGLAGVVIALTSMMAAFAYLNKGATAVNFDELGSTLLKMSIAIGILAVVCKLIGKLTEDEMINGIKFAGGFLAFVAVLRLISLIPGGEFGNLGKTLMGISVAMSLMVGVMKLISMMEPEEFNEGYVGLWKFVGVIAVLSLIAKFGGGKKLASTLMGMSIAMGIMVGVVKLISMMKPEDFDKGIEGLWSFVGIIAVLTLITKLGGSSKMAGSLLAISASIAILAGVAIALSLIDIEGLAQGVTAIMILSICMAMMEVAASKAKDSMGSIIALTVAIGIMATAIAVLSMIDEGKLSGATKAMAAVMAMFSLMEVAASKAKDSMGSIIAMTAAIAVIGTAIYLLAGLPVEATLGSAAALSVLLLSLSASCAILGLAGKIAPSALVSAVVMTLIVEALASIIYKLASTDIGSTLEIAASLSILLLSLSASCAILALAGSFGLAALAGIGVLTAIIVGIGALIIGIAALMQEFPQLQEFLDKGIPALNQIGNAIGSFVGSIISGLLEGAVSGLPEIGTTLSTFMNNLSGFIEGSKNIDESSMNGVKALSSAIISLCGANLMEGITSFLTGGKSLEDFSNQIVAFGKAMVEFSNTVKGNIDESAVTAAANAGKILIELQKNMYGTGGVIQWFSGEKDLSSFGQQLCAFGRSIVDFSQIVSGKINEEAITSAANAGKVMIEMNKSLPATGGIIQKFTGEKDMGTFATQLKAFGKAVVEYAEEVSGLDTESITISVTAARDLANLANAIPSTGGIFGLFNGKNDIKSFGKKLKSFGKSLKNYGEEVNGINTSAISNATTAIRSIVNLANSTSGVDFGGLSSLGKSLKNIGGTSIDDFVSSFKDSSSKVKEAGKSLMENIKSGIESGKTSVSSAITQAANRIKDSYDSFKSAGKHLGNGLIAGIEAKEQAAYDAGYKLGQKAVQGEKDGQQSHSPSKLTIKAGKWIGEGLVIGIDSMGKKVYNAGYRMGDTAAGSLSKAVSKIRDSINTDMDTQPTIRPVLDLSDIKAGSGMIGDLLGYNHNVGLMANVNAISSSMNTNQNGRNDDVVSAIKDLKRSINNLSGDTYQINGVTYDDRSNISNAVKSIVRAARVERRV